MHVFSFKGGAKSSVNIFCDLYAQFLKKQRLKLELVSLHENMEI